jgi:hypothetical protein
MPVSIGTRIGQLIYRHQLVNLTRQYVLRYSQNLGEPVVRDTTVSFTAPDTISDSGNRFGGYGVGQVVRVKYSALNSRDYRIETVAAGALTVSPAMIQSAVAGPVISVRQI